MRKWRVFRAIALGDALAECTRVRTLALLVSMVVGCAPTIPTLARTAPPPGTPHVIAELRVRFHPHWDELCADPSPAAARTRAMAVTQAIAGDSELYSYLVQHDSIERVVERAIRDAERAAEAFPNASDVWTMLAKLRARLKDMRGAATAACRASDVDPKSDTAAELCLEALLDAGDRDAATARAKTTLAALDATKRDRLRAAIKARDAVVGAAMACEPLDASLAWDELIACGDLRARSGDRVSARARYHAAFLVAPDRDTQFRSLLRVESLGYDCTAELMMLPAERADQYPLWKSMNRSLH